MRLSIAIVNWNSTGLLRSLLTSIHKYPPDFEYETIVVDNASDDFDLQTLTGDYPWVNFIANSSNDGYARGNNIAFEHCGGEYVLLLNPDTEVTPQSIDKLISFMDDHPKAAAAGAKLVRPDGKLDPSVRGFPYPGSLLWETTGLSKIFIKNRTIGAYRATWFDYDSTVKVEQPMGSALVIRASVMKEIGTFDERFPIFFNEVDWLYRAQQAGYDIYFVHDAVVVHHGAGSTKMAPKRVMIRESHKSLRLFYAKHFKGRIAWPLFMMIDLAIRAGCVCRLLRTRE